MAYTTGTAANHIDLWDKLLAFLTTDPALLAAGQQWTIGWRAPVGAANETDHVLIGPGMGGTDQVLVGLRRVDNVNNNSFAIYMNGMTGILPAATAFDGHVNVCRRVTMYLDQNPMRYWFVANGRRFVVVVKISTVYEAMYGGLFLPYADPLSYPYPLFIGGSGGVDFDTTYNWTNTYAGHSHFITPYGNEGGAPNRSSSARMLTAAAEWLNVDNGSATAATPPLAMAPYKWGTGFGTILTDLRATGYYNMFPKLVETLGGGFALHPVTMVQNAPDNQTFGVLDGVFHVPGENNAAENIVTANGIDHLVIQNVFRTHGMAYWALALE